MADLFELVERCKADAKLSLLAFAFANLDVEAESFVQLRLDCARVRVLALLPLGLCGTPILRERLDLAHVQSAAHDTVGERDGIGPPDERPHVTRAQLRAAFDQGFGAGAGARVALSCERGLITELLINLRGAITLTTPLADLIAAAQPRSGGCAGGRVDRAGLRQ